MENFSCDSERDYPWSLGIFYFYFGDSKFLHRAFHSEEKQGNRGILRILEFRNLQILQIFDIQYERKTVPI